MTALREQWQAQSQQRQAEANQRRRDVQDHLNTLNRSRLEKGRALYQQLSQAEQHRQAQAQQMRTDLGQYTSELQATVQTMQAQLQAQLVALHSEAEALRAAQGQERMVAGQDNRQNLAAYVEALKADVTVHLADAAAFVEDLSLQQQHVTATNREQRHRSVDALFVEFTHFRQQLVTDRANLRQLVWGNTPTAPSTTTTSTTRTARRPKSQGASKPAPATEATSIPEVSIEERVYTHLQTQASGARLTEIEAGLQINRFQAVDALRSLIQKDLIVQKDRTYFIQEDPMP